MNGKWQTWVPWSTLLVFTPVLYLLSFIPLAWAWNHKYLSDAVWDPIRPAYVAPIVYCSEKGPPSVKKALDSYQRFLNSL
jgi:hypothetical protein